MQVTAYKLRKLVPPQDDFKKAILETSLSLKEGDVFVIASKIISIAESRTISITEKNSTEAAKEKLLKLESDWYIQAPKSSRWHRYYTIARGVLIGSAGIDESNGEGHYILYPKDPFKSARTLRTWLMKSYGIKNLGVIISDSASTPLRYGAIGIALAWDGFDPLRDYKKTKDLFGREITFEMANLVDALAASAVLEMGEGSEMTPIAVIRDANNIVFKNRSPRAKEQLIVDPKDDVYAGLFWGKKWKKGEGLKKI